MISQFCIQLNVCITKTTTRTAVIDIPYQEFVFPCPGCSVEIRFGMEIKAPDWWYTKFINAVPLDTNEGITNVRVFDASHLMPLDNSKSFSPYMETAEILDGDDFLMFHLMQGINQKIVDEYWPQVAKIKNPLSKSAMGFV